MKQFTTPCALHEKDIIVRCYKMYNTRKNRGKRHLDFRFNLIKQAMISLQGIAEKELRVVIVVVVVVFYSL